MTLKQVMDDLAIAKSDLDDNPNNQKFINAYNQALDNSKSMVIRVKNLSKEERTKVQDALFSMGYNWVFQSKAKYNYDDVVYYVTDNHYNIILSSVSISTDNLITYDELMALAGMDNKGNEEMNELEELRVAYDKMGEKIKQLEDRKKNKRAFGFLPEYAGKAWMAECITTGYSPIPVAFINPKNNCIYLKTKEECQDWCDALNVQNELRNCEGVKRWDKGENDFVIYLSVDCLELTSLKSIMDLGAIYFESEDAAKKAIETIGEERLIKSFKVLS